jgi:hypothetical protein
MDRLWPLLLLFTLSPVGVCLGLARRARRRVHILDDVICELALPLMVVTFFAPLSPAMSRLIFGAAMAICGLSLWRTIGGYRKYRRAQRVDGPPPGR